MKKIVSVLLIVLLSISLLSCSGQKNAQTPSEEEKIVRDFPEGNYSEKGTGNVYISTSGGTSENENVPVIYADKNSMISIGLNAFDFNGTALSYVYVDGMSCDKKQLANTQTSIRLNADQLSEGIHTVEVVQFENDDPSCEMITYRCMKYEVRAIK